MRFCLQCASEDKRGAVGHPAQRSPSRGTSSHQGRLGELLFLHAYPDAVDARSEYGHRAPFDAYHPLLQKVNVKTVRGREGSWPFQLEGIQNADHVFMVGLSPDGTEVSHVWLASSGEMPLQLKVLTPTSREYDGTSWELNDLVPVLSRLLSTISEVDATSAQDAAECYSRTVLGRIGELFYKSLHPESEHVSEEDPHSPFDFLDPDGSRVDIKLRRPDKRGRWTFTRQSSAPDQLFCVGLSRDGKTIQEAYRVPESVLPSRGFSVSPQGQSKWHQYRVLTAPQLISDVLGVSDLDRVSSEISCVTRESLDSLQPDALGTWVQEVLAYHRALGFPYPTLPSEKRLASEIRQIEEYDGSEAVLLPLNAGLGLCSAYMPHRFDTRHAAADFTALGAFKDDRRLERAIRFALSGKSPDVSRRGLRSALTALNKTPTNFRPAVAKALVSRFCPPRGLVLDPCAGWGGRLMGTLVAGRRYFGVDSSEKTIKGLRRLGLRLSEHLGLPSDRVVLQHAKFQEVDFPVSDFALTSPPYWTQEEYDGSVEEGLDVWVRGFLLPLFQKTAESLRKGGTFVVNISDVPRGRDTLPLERMAREAATLAGFDLQETLHMSKSTFGPSQKTLLPLFVFQRGT